MPLHDIDIASLIPHAGSMCLLDAVDTYDQQRIVCSASSHRATHNPLRHADQLSIQTGIEYAAQAVRHTAAYSCANRTHRLHRAAA